MKCLQNSFILWILVIVLFSCRDDEKEGDLTKFPYNPTAYQVNLPSHFPPLPIPADNPLTTDGIQLGRFLFYDPILSADSSMSCASCHFPDKAFTDGNAVSKGIDGIAGRRSSMSLINIGYVQSGLFWDGRAKTLEEQALMPVEDPIELHHTWPKVIEKLRKHPTYPARFRAAFGITNTSEISKELAAKAIAQFERIMISQDSKYDRIQQGKDFYSDLELVGQGLFFDDDPDLPDAECSHCHNVPLATSDDFFNNRITESATLDGFDDLGKGKVTGFKAENGKFRAPTLRNISGTGPYMHDGRFKTLDEVLAHYNSGGKPSPNGDPLLHPLKLTAFHMKALKAFLETFNDTLFNKKPELQNPFK
jgi:cytochrome c peroxidase